MAEVVSIDQALARKKRSVRQVSVFGMDFTPRTIRFFLNHWIEMVSLAEASSEDSVRDLREALRYEFDHLKPGRIPCRCGDGLEAPALVGGGGGGAEARSFSDIVPSIELAYKELPIAWRGRTQVYLLMLGHSEQEIYELKQSRMFAAPGSAFDRMHAERFRSEMSSPGFRARSQDAIPETESPYRRMAECLGWVAPEEEEQAA